MNTTTEPQHRQMRTGDRMCPATPPPQPTTANQAAAVLFPKISEHFNAFWEKEAPFHEAPNTEILDLNDDYWALSLGPSGNQEQPTIFDTAEGQFRRYNPDKGIYTPIHESAVVGMVLSNLELCADLLPERVNFASFIAVKNRQRAKDVVKRARELLALDPDADFFLDHKQGRIVLANGILQLDGQVFHESHPARAVKETLPVKYDPDAKCDLFLNSFLKHILTLEDIDLVQRYLSQMLEGKNHSQKIPIFTGDSGWGKSSLMKILGTIIGWDRVGIIREALFKDEYELAHYANKRFLFHPDMPTDFLDRKEASVFKQLVGSDPLWANVKGDEGRIVIQGDFPVILACNGKPKIHIDEDADAWLRRLVVVEFKTPAHEQHMGKLAEMIVRTEASGILNWLLEGRQKLSKDKFQLKMTPQQQSRAANLLMASQSPAAFIESCLERRDGAKITAMDLYSHYQQFCQSHNVRPFASQAFTQMAKEEIELKLGLRYRHDLGEQGTNRGWKGVGLVERTKIEKIQIESAESDISI